MSFVLEQSFLLAVMVQHEEKYYQRHDYEAGLAQPVALDDAFHAFPGELAAIMRGVVRLLFPFVNCLFAVSGSFWRTRWLGHRVCHDSPPNLMDLCAVVFACWKGLSSLNRHRDSLPSRSVYRLATRSMTTYLPSIR